MSDMMIDALRWLRAEAGRLDLDNAEAADLMSAELGVPRSSAIRNIRNARKAIKELLGSEPEPVEQTAPTMVLDEDEDGVELDADEPTSDTWRYYPETHEYVFRIKGDSFDTPREEVADLVWWYTRTAGNKTQREVCRLAQQEHGRTLTRDYLKRMLAIMGVTKDAPPWAPHDLARYTDEELSKLMFARLQAEAESTYTREAPREYKRLWQQAEKRARDQDRIVEAITAALEARPRRELEPVEVASTRTMAVVGLYDCHIGKRSDAGGLKESVTTMVGAVRKLAARLVDTRAPERIVVAVGGDYLHIDNMASTTTAGTPQDVDASAPRILAAAIEALEESVGILASVAPVGVVIIPGNHDRMLAYAVMQAVARSFASHDRVEVNVHHNTRAYVRYGRCLVGFEHGDGPKAADLASIMSTERRVDWGATLHHSWIVGHLHHIHEREVAGCHVLQAPSLAGADAWHKRKGYVTSTRALRAYLFDPLEGAVGQIQVSV